MDSNIDSFIDSIQNSNFFAGCPYCYKEISLSEALLFNGMHDFPSQAEVTRLEWEKNLEQRFLDLKKRKEKAKRGAEKTTIAVGLGKIIEKILPAHKNFNMISSDCRFLAEPIDMVVFHGLSDNKINSITFMDVKTGNAKLNDHQKKIRDAVNDKKVKWKVL